MYLGNYDRIYAARYFLTLQFCMIFLGELLLFSMNHLTVGLEAF